MAAKVRPAVAIVAIEASDSATAGSEGKNYIPLADPVALCPSLCQCFLWVWDT